MRLRHVPGKGAIAAAVGAALLATACSGSDEQTVTDPTTVSPSADASTDGGIAVAIENGLVVLDGDTLEILGEFDSEEFTRLNAVGDGRHLLVTTTGGFQVLDTATPELTDLVFEAETPAHVVRHHGKTVLYDDGTSNTVVFDTDALLTNNDELPSTRMVPGDEAHHGVSIVLEDGTLLTTIGNADGRTGVRALDTESNEVARSEECPGVHGEGTAADEAVVFGCEDGALLYDDGAFEKLTAPDEYGRMGNAYVSETSPLIVGDYKNDPDAEGYLLNMVTLIDTEAHTYEAIELPDGIEYTWRGIARGPNDQAYVLATDGSIYVMDPATGEMRGQYPVIAPWEGPDDWQNPHPALVVDGDIGYVTEPASNTIHAVDLTSGVIVKSTELPDQPNEVAVA
ncbi:hypothetical protein EV641_1191 [Rhodococcus sp. SMB37]|uniref:zinc metallochaperone AztD n=1 Tax=Rhodococcus sp. SMB37 TaxID=2512213 RepID=UPI0006CF7B41|nr:zinc metallochaperone AztD [Rhodococcus sp. SMB37]TCN47290.1 hypothetical protein EV641_1191 [Rhodococcus sp. SMB37]